MAVLRCRVGRKMRRQSAGRVQESLSAPSAEGFHCAFSLPVGWCESSFGLFQLIVLPVLSCRQCDAVRDLEAGKRVDDQHPCRATLMFEEYAKEPGCGLHVRFL